ncbi:MAG: hypothetical protein K2N78_05575, partial [Oscillospiraceae bacterium]|nr:hypothetical protein [Oscillospiraceae bacterium]
NSLKWGDLEDPAYAQVFAYYKGLIAFRKAHGALRLTTAQDVASAVSAVDGLDANVLAFDIQGGVNGETAEELFVIFNANETSATVALPEGNWNVYINGESAGTQALASISDGSAVVDPISAMVLVKEDGVVVSAGEPANTAAEGSGVNTGLIAGVAAAAVCAGAAFAVTRKKAKKS